MERCVNGGSMESMAQFQLLWTWYQRANAYHSKNEDRIVSD
jgi:hypothetical protein